MPNECDHVDLKLTKMTELHISCYVISQKIGFCFLIIIIIIA